MNNVLQLLQRLGEDAALRHLADTQLEKVINPLNLDPAIQQAISQQDDITLARLVHANNKIVCMIIPAEEPEDKPADQPAKQPEDVPEPPETEIKQAG
ncbi:hypothetical protein [Arsukibacterium indicum]|uniref:Uncharacterized protein n=1 Tax=Arsukibacterium indicum TaxID=2848612 RepID=A0ABS6MMI5_9GAMM|nr:hypothetical protein [Arsukibacterium indicum]MBV2129795.1 hypothetical protein [Arsukibacterium indicum]